MPESAELLGSSPPATDAPLLSIGGASKRFGAVQALDSVSIDCRPGEVHALVGENGSGKSTLLGIASGLLSPDTGTVTVGNQDVAAVGLAVMRARGVSLAFQTYSHVNDLTVAENLLLASTRRVWRLRSGDLQQWAAAELDDVGVHLDPAAVVGTLSLADRQLLEIAKALLGKPRVVLLDEPTSALAPEEVEVLHGIVREQARRGVGFLYVSHRLPEIFGISDRITVLRDGTSQGTYDAHELTEESLLTLMIGRPVELAFPHRGKPSDTVALEAKDLAGPGFGPINLVLRRGEILGVAGADGNGQKEFMRALGGAGDGEGSVRCDGTELDRRSPGTALKQGVMLLSGERLRESLFPVAGVRANSTVQVLDRFARLGLMRRRPEVSAVQEAVSRLKVRTPSLEQPVRFLSGGNQQKVVFSRLFHRPVKVLLVEEPTQGVDVGSRFEIYQMLREEARRGLAVVVQSSDPVELTGLCDRVVAMSRGRVTEELEGEELSEERIVGAFVRSRDTAPTGAGRDPDATSSRRHLMSSWWIPPLALLLVTAVAGAYTAGRAEMFLSSFNLNSLLLSMLPLALLALGQLHAIVLGEFDLSVGALAGFAVVVGSFVLAGPGAASIVLGVLAVIAMAVAVGTVNAGLVRLVGIPSIIATIATLSVLQGLALTLRPTPAGMIDFALSDLFNKGVGIVPYAVILVGVLAVLSDLWLHHTRGGLAVRASGLDGDSALRLGLPVRWLRARALLLSAVLAGAGGLFLAAQVGVGDARLGGSFTLASIAACVLGGASLAGGRGSFLGAVVGALFLSLILNALPMLGWSSAVGDISRGAITLLALAAFQGGAIWALVRRIR